MNNFSSKWWKFSINLFENSSRIELPFRLFRSLLRAFTANRHQAFSIESESSRVQSSAARFSPLEYLSYEIRFSVVMEELLSIGFNKAPKNSFHRHHHLGILALTPRCRANLIREQPFCATRWKRLMRPWKNRNIYARAKKK